MRSCRFFLCRAWHCSRADADLGEQWWWNCCSCGTQPGLAEIGLACAGGLRVEVSLTGTNGPYLLPLLWLGIVIPNATVRAAVQWIMVGLPSAALADGSC